jgi:hypothetical protein
VGSHRDPLGRETVEVDEIGLRALGDGQHSSGAARGAWNDHLERQAVEEAHRLGLPLEREVVDGHDRRARAAQGQRVLEVRHVRPQPSERARDGPRHSQLLRPSRQRDRLDSGRDEIGPPAERGEAQLVATELGEAPKQVLHVRLVPRPLAPEHVRVDDDERAHAAASR